MMDGTLQNTYDINDNLEEVKRNRAALNIKVRFVFINVFINYIINFSAWHVSGYSIVTSLQMTSCNKPDLNRLVAT